MRNSFRTFVKDLRAAGWEKPLLVMTWRTLAFVFFVLAIDLLMSAIGREHTFTHGYVAGIIVGYAYWRRSFFYRWAAFRRYRQYAAAQRQCGDPRATPAEPHQGVVGS